ncbi:MAG TPA: hypothetical protein VMU39_03495 [Solirubrobacteraceae bacterium]|nr:hypothetical protein [Solirubrobacteraceae bacterium]
MKRIAILVVALAIALMIPSVALGQSSTCQAYNPQDCQSTTETEATTTATTSTLPFTGLDVALLAVGGGALLGVGFVVRRLSTSRQD